MIKNKKKYIRFDFLEKKPKTMVYAVVNIKFGNILGVIKWHSAWRKYCFFSEGNVIYDTICLNEISEFIKGLMDKRKLGKELIKALDGTDIFEVRDKK
ncbi:hypothetical protein LCGC14_0223090 [marine sediment metagenome]|uniref:Uncharacterized protein n=1 Tax=marine sediment metagenome TaxID=412755 RepID=A0A0F9WWE0_9ZZZZ|nr:hypothetical protein [bacterium]